MAAKRRRRGTTLAELLVAVVFLAICVSGIVACLVTSRRNASYSGRRAIALAAATSAIELARADAASGALAEGTGEPVAVPGIPGAASYRCAVSLVPGYSDLFQVTVGVVWKENRRGVERNDSLTLSTWMRSPDG